MTSLLHFWIITSISHKLSICGLSELHYLFPLAILVQNQLSLEQNINICERNEDIKFVTRARARARARTHMTSYLPHLMIFHGNSFAIL